MLVAAAGASGLGWLAEWRNRGGGGGGREEEEERWQRKGEGGGIIGLTINLLAFSLRVSLIYIRGVTIANGLSP